jgi:hypothetical protein
VAWHPSPQFSRSSRSLNDGRHAVAVRLHRPAPDAAIPAAGSVARANGPPAMRNAPASLLAATCLAAALAPASVAAQTVYKWKDARGVTHYSERPPVAGRYTQQDGKRDPVAAKPAAKADQAAKPDPRCNTARGNLATLQGKAPVQMDSDGDGKPDRTLTDAERANQADLARSTLKAYNCTETAPAA